MLSRAGSHSCLLSCCRRVAHCAHCVLITTPSQWSTFGRLMATQSMKSGEEAPSSTKQPAQHQQPSCNPRTMSANMCEGCWVEWPPVCTHLSTCWSSVCGEALCLWPLKQSACPAQQRDQKLAFVAQLSLRRYQVFHIPAAVVCRRRQARASKQLGGRVMADTDRAFSEGADVEQWQRWAVGPSGLGSDGSGRAGKK